MGATKSDIETSYNVGNEFFRLWLDEGMSYSGARFVRDDDTLEVAQRQKLAFLADAARVTPGCSVLDLGCGWGANLEYLSRERGAGELHGITLASEQEAEVRRRVIPRVTTACVSYLDYRPPVAFDAVVSIGMMEHVLSPEEAQAGRALEVYRRYFRAVHGFCKSGAHFGLQTIVRDRVPRAASELRDLAWATRTVFPGSIAPRLEEVVCSIAPWWELASVHTARVDYQRTCEHWLRRLRDRRDVIETRYGAALYRDYERYLGVCVRGFERRYLSLCRFSLRRIDDAG